MLVLALSISYFDLSPHTFFICYKEIYEESGVWTKLFYYALLTLYSMVQNKFTVKIEYSAF